MRNRAGRLTMATGSVLVGFLLGGCGSSRVTPTVGNVTVDDRPVRSGQVVFVGGADGQKHATVIGFDGRYSIELPPGDYKVGVEPTAQSSIAKMAGAPKSASAPAHRPKGLPAMKDPTGQVPGTGVDLAKEMEHPVVIPMKYRAPEGSGLSFTVTGKGDTFDIPMKSKG